VSNDDYDYDDDGDARKKGISVYIYMSLVGIERFHVVVERQERDKDEQCETFCSVPSVRDKMCGRSECQDCVIFSSRGFYSLLLHTR